MFHKIGKKYRETALIKLIIVGLILGIIIALAAPQAVPAVSVLGELGHVENIIGMDEENMRDLYRLFPQDTVHKLHLFLSFANEQRDVADSWFTGNFEQTYQDVVRGCAELLDRLIDKFA